MICIAVSGSDEPGLSVEADSEGDWEGHVDRGAWRFEMGCNVGLRPGHDLEVLRRALIDN